MLKFIILLVAVFALFFIGGSLLFDQGIVESGGQSRIPVAVATQEFVGEVWNRVGEILEPATSYVSGQAGGLLDQEQLPQE